MPHGGPANPGVHRALWTTVENTPLPVEHAAAGVHTLCTLLWTTKFAAPDAGR
ncbi:MAG: hypothetical protein JWO46_2073 [Nocardioidaceae bacterium]|nr:hypothetical protein [Nocardioidaceae bacterium]